MVAQRQPIDRVIDLAVGFPVATAVAARRSVPLVKQAARQGVQRAAKRATRRFAVIPASEHHTDERAPRRGEVVEPLVPQASQVEVPDHVLPIDDYDHLAARQVVDRLHTLTGAELAQISVYERAHRHRQTILSRIAQLQS